MEIDVEMVAGIAVELQQSSEAVTGVAGVVARLGFGAETAGRNYGDVGGRIAAGFDGVEASVRRWSEASKDNAVRLRAAVAEYRGADNTAAQAMTTQAGER